MDRFLMLYEENPRFFTNILDSIKDAIFISDEKGQVLWINKTSEEILDISKNEIIGKNVQDLEKDGIFTPSVSRKALEAGKNVSIVQMMRNKRKYITTGHIVKDKNGQHICTVAHCRDIDNVMQNTSEMDEIVKLLEEYSQEIRRLTSTKNKETFNDLKSISKERLECNSLIRKIASVDTTTLITGETGTGKSIAAEKIHSLSERYEGPFLQINCATLPESLLESELFGYEKGSFTGAASQGKSGLIQEAENGTLFLDEISELPLYLQSKLLYFLQNKKYLPIGARKYKSANVRIIAATNQNLEQMVEERTFRADLYFRLNILVVKMPKLRGNIDDIQAFSSFFLKKFNHEYHTKKSFSKKVIHTFNHYSWPGNIRELENLIERLVILSEGDEITPYDLPQKMMSKKYAPDKRIDILNKPMPEYLETIEKELIITALNKTHSTRKAAEFLGVSQSLIMRRIKKYNLQLSYRESKTYVVNK